jgi:hypothetical protein
MLTIFIATVTRKKMENAIAALLNFLLLMSIRRWNEDNNSEVTRSVTAVMASKMLRSSKFKGKIMTGVHLFHPLYDIQR